MCLLVRFLVSRSELELRSDTNCPLGRRSRASARLLRSTGIYHTARCLRSSGREKESACEMATLSVSASNGLVTR